MLLPTGNVTFLFSDIEGSTRLLGSHPREYARALIRHDEVMRNAITAQGGVVFETIGDAVYAVFASPSDGLRSALRAQVDLRREDWGPMGAITVRMAVHGGEVELRGTHYFGPALYLCARIMSAGHGGQLLLSESWANAVKNELPAGAELRPLGTHRLKDIAEPQSIFQVTHPDLVSEFPPLRSLQPHATNLPAAPNRLVGRENEIAQVRQLLRSKRLLTLTGTGGAGKTRLSVHACAGMLGEFDGGVWFVALASIRDARLVPSAIASALGIIERPNETAVQAVKRHIAGQEILLILDNFEQVLDASPLVAELLATCPELKVVVTSRTPLHLGAEHQFAVPALAVDPARVISAPNDSDAVTLFVERALAMRSNLPLDAAGLATIRDICVRLDGLPLAIELAAARTRVLSLAAIKARLGQVLPLLQAPQGDRPDRQRSMAAAIGWSYDLLDETDRVLFARLGVFAGGFTIASACRISDELTEVAVLDALARLVDASLVERAVQPDGELRFAMFESIREFALERLAEGNELEHVRAEHAAWSLEYAEAAEARLRGSDMATWLARVEDEQPNLRTALDFFIARGSASPALRMCWGLGWFWITRSHLAEGRRWAEAALATHSDSTPNERGRVSLIAGQIALQQGDVARSRHWHEAALASARSQSDHAAVANITCDLGNVALREGDSESALALCEESLALRRQLGHPAGIAHALVNLAEVFRFRDEHAEAGSALAECLALGADGDLLLVARFDEAMLELERGDVDRAFGRIVQSLSEWRALKADVYVSSCLVGLAGVALEKEDTERAGTLLGAADALLEPGGAVLWPADERTRSRIVARTTHMLGEVRFNDLFQAGRHLSLEQAADLAESRIAAP